MDMEQIECVLAVTKYGSFTEASYQIAITQSAITKKISRLEKELDVILFDRANRPIMLTEAGQAFVEQAQTIAATYKLLQHSLKEYRISSRQLVIGTIYFSYSHSIAPQIAHYATAHPEIKIETLYSMTSQLIESLLTGDIDVAIVSSMYFPDEHPPKNFSGDARFLSASFSKNPYFLAVSDKHHLAGRNIVDYQDIVHEKFIAPHPKMDVYHTAFNEVFKQKQMRPNITVHSGSTRDTLRLVSENVGVAMVSSAVISDSSGVKLIPMKRPLIRDNQILIRRENRIPVHTQRFFDYFINIYRCDSGG
jgi:LysR family hydrogen peroxide-inducible transcriptional activator